MSCREQRSLFPTILYILGRREFQFPTIVSIPILIHQLYKAPVGRQYVVNLVISDRCRVWKLDLQTFPFHIRQWHGWFSSQGF